MSSQQLLAHSPSLCVKSFPRAWLCLQRGVGVLCHCCLALGSRRGPSLRDIHPTAQLSFWPLLSGSPSHLSLVCQACPQGTGPLWELTFYNPVTPASNVTVFQLRHFHCGIRQAGELNGGAAPDWPVQFQQGDVVILKVRNIAFVNDQPLNPAHFHLRA